MQTLIFMISVSKEFPDSKDAFSWFSLVSLFNGISTLVGFSIYLNLQKDRSSKI